MSLFHVNLVSHLLDKLLVLGLRIFQNRHLGVCFRVVSVDCKINKLLVVIIGYRLLFLRQTAIANKAKL